MAKFRQGIYEVQNKDKYLGAKNPRFMSSWELEFFRFLDRHTNVLKWGAETVIVPYYSPIDQRNRRYMVDIYVEFLKGGKVTKELIEVKPKKELFLPKKTGRKKKETYLREMYTWNVNQAKWAAAKKFAEARGWVFRVMTEDQLFRT